MDNCKTGTENESVDVRIEFIEPAGLPDVVRQRNLIAAAAKPVG
jgi:hypothetical protein